jgi:hypothetical protein
MSDLSDSFNQNLGFNTALGNIAGVAQRNRLLAAQKQQLAVLERQYAETQRTEAARLELEKRRVELEQLRADAEAEERALRQEQLERIKEIRNFMADTIAGFDKLKKLNP